MSQVDTVNAETPYINGQFRQTTDFRMRPVRHQAGRCALTVAVVTLAALTGCRVGSSDIGGLSLTSAKVPGSPTLTAATAGDGQAVLTFTAPTSNGGAAITAYTAACTAGAATATATGAASPLTVTGLSNGTAYACTVAATNRAGTGVASASLTVTPSAPASSVATYSAPAPFSSVLATAYQATSLTQASALTNRGRYLLSDAVWTNAAARYLTIGTTYNANTGYAAEAASINTGATYNTYLTKLVQVVSDSYGYFRFDSHLHPNDAIDADANDNYALKFRNNFGKAAVTYGYVTFSYDAATHLIQARKRYLYSYDSTTYAATYSEDTNFSAANYYVSLANGAYMLVSEPASATQFYLYESPLDFGIPSAMNPKAVPYVSNATAAFWSKTSVASVEGPNGLIETSVNATYHAQVATAGADAGTKAAADAMLASIKSAVEGAGEKLRYPISVYSTFRDAALATKLVSDAIADGTPGQNLVPYVYFTNEKDDSGKYHPFMIMVNYGNPASANGLIDVPRPPGDGNGAGYGDQKVTRLTNLDNYLTRIPMKDYGLVSAVTDNTLPRTLLSDVGGSLSSADVYNYASIADNGVLINGAVMFPAYNNTLVPSQVMGELSANGCHVGQGGGGPHCHADGFQTATAPGVALYSDADYVNKTHPPLIGFGYDGVALFGIYRAGKDSSMLGASVALDSFGGHNHDGIGYHYHAHTVPNFAMSDGTTITLNVLMKGAFAGNINSVPNAFGPPSFSTNRYLGGTVK